MLAETVVVTDHIVCQFVCVVQLYVLLLNCGWWRGIAVMCCVQSTKFVYAGPG